MSLKSQKNHDNNQTIRITITPEIEKALKVLSDTTMGTLNSTELIKWAIGEFASLKKDPKK